MAASGGDRAGENMQPMWAGQEQGQQSQPGMPQQPGAKQQPRMNLTKEEMQALQDCSRESFYYRCIPLGLLFMGTTQILVNKHVLRGHPRLGAIPKNMFAGLIAYIIGKVSYQGECRRKIMALENSPLGAAMRKGKRGRELMTDMSIGGLAGSFGAQESQAVDDEDPSKLKDSYLESGTQGLELDDKDRPNIDNMTERAPEKEVQSYTTYEELRKQNRMEHERKISPTDSPPSFAKQPASKSQYSREPSAPRPRTNKYGDVIED